ncbi:MAG: CPBP family intramembrane metalloprotease [Planctomycetales bacterium]|nr:CPBP family intramembrane metalloprotease [Planctomycetales bacterium]
MEYGSKANQSIAGRCQSAWLGAGHLPTAACILPLTPIWIARVIVLNGLFAVAAGYLFWKRGLESAILAHWMADIVLHVTSVLENGRRATGLLDGICDQWKNS